MLFKMGLCLWICRDSKILKYVILLDVLIIVKSRICTLGNEDVHTRTNSRMLRDPGVKSATGRRSKEDMLSLLL